MPFSVLPAPSQLVLKHIRPNQPCWQACGWVWSLVGLYSYFHNVFVERWHGHRWCDQHAAINLCQISPYPIYSFTMIYFNQKARLLCTILKTFLFPCMTGCMTYFSDGCIWFLLPLVHKKMCTIFFSARFQKMCPFKGLKKKGVRSSVALHSNQPDSFPKGSIGHFCHALMHVQHAKYDLEQPRLTTWVASQHM